jgi:hypothetical protein
MTCFGACLAALLLLNSPSTLLAARLPGPVPSVPALSQAMNFTVEGKISKLSPGKFTISTEENIIFHVRYDDKTEIKQQDGSPGSSKDLRVGVSVRIEGELTESGEIIAQRIYLK